MRALPRDRRRRRRLPRSRRASHGASRQRSMRARSPMPVGGRACATGSPSSPTALASSSRAGVRARRHGLAVAVREQGRARRVPRGNARPRRSRSAVSTSSRRRSCPALASTRAFFAGCARRSTDRHRSPDEGSCSCSRRTACPKRPGGRRPVRVRAWSGPRTRSRAMGLAEGGDSSLSSAARGLRPFGSPMRPAVVSGVPVQGEQARGVARARSRGSDRCVAALRCYGHRRGARSAS